MHKQHVKGKMCRASAAVCGAVLAASSWAAETAQSAAPKINDPARGWDSLWHEVIVDITIIGILFAVVTAWFVFTSRRTAGNQTRAIASGGIDERQDLVELRFIGRRPHLGCGQPRIAHDDLPGARGQPFDHAVIDAALHVDTVRGEAVLA